MTATRRDAKATLSTTMVRGVCAHDCPDSCGWVATVDADGRATRLRGDPDHPYSRGELCPKVNRYLDRVYSPDRLTTPLRRTGPKGEGHFEPITWVEALTEIAERVTAQMKRFGGETVLPFVSAGSQATLAIDFPNRLWNRMGASRLTGSLCGTVAAAGTALTLGTPQAVDANDLRHAKLVILWGTNTRLTNRHLWPVVQEARANGAPVVVIDPLRTVTAEAADWFLQPRPGTDIALMLAMAHVLFRDDFIDHQWVAAHTEGVEEFAAAVEAWPPARAAEVCGLATEDVERLATMYGTSRPTHLRTLIGAEHREHGAMFFRTLSCLPALTGDYRYLGGGYSRSVGTWMYNAADQAALTRADLRPAGRVPRALGMAQLADVLTDPDLDPPVTVTFVVGGNPVVTAPDANRVRAGMCRDDNFVVVHEQFLTDTARCADVVLPATTQLEVTDVVPPWGHLYLAWNHPAIAPVGQSVSNQELCRRLARAFGYTDPALFDDDVTALTTAYGADLVHRLRTEGPQRLAVYPEGHVPYANGGFPTSSGRLLLRSAALAAQGAPAVPVYEPPAERSGVDPRYPFSVIVTKWHTRLLNSSYTHLPHHGGREGDGPWVEIHPVDAAHLRLTDGDQARVWNARGELILPVRVSDRVRPDVVMIPWGWWRVHTTNQATGNCLTNASLTDWGGGAAYLDTTVAVAPFAR